MPPDARSSDSRGNRPLLVSVSAGLFFLGGVGLLLLEAFAASFDTRFPPLLLRLVILGVGLYQIVTAIGLWKGESRGWWMATVYLGLAIGRATGTALAFPDYASAVADAIEAGDAFGLRDPRRYLARIPLNILLLAYFFTPRPERFFSVPEVPRSRRFLVVAGAFLVSFTLFTVLGPPGGG